MMNSVQTNLVNYLQIEVITPVHIGAGPDKKWINGLDYFYDKGTIKFFDVAELLNGKNEDYIAKITNLITSGNLFKSGLINKNQIKPKIQYPHDIETGEIFAHIRNGFGNIYIPGSSLKGAFRSALLGYLYQNDTTISRIGRVKDIDDKVFGDVRNSIMRFLQITDTEFNSKDANLFNTKIYSLNFNKKGQWKIRNGSTPNFEDKNFVSTYECLNFKSKSVTRIAITEKIIKLFKDKPANTHKIIKTDIANPVIEILKMINEHTKNYLDKEIIFFERHQGDKSDIIIDYLKKLKYIADNCSEGECLLHLGSGSGFHGITGDWQFDSHIITNIREIKNKKGEVVANRGQINNEDAAKTRRLIFEKQDNDCVFYPMGFVKLSIVDKNTYEKFLYEKKKLIKQ